MDTYAHLRGLGWRGTGHSLDAHNRGIKRPVLVGAKADKKGLGANHDFGDQWWLRALDQGLKGLGKGEETVLSRIQKSGANRGGGLYRFFVKGQTLDGTFSSEEATSSSTIHSNSITPPTSIEASSQFSGEDESTSDSSHSAGSDSESVTNQSTEPDTPINGAIMTKANKKRKANDAVTDNAQPPKKRKRAVSGNNGALAVPAATIATFEGAAALPDGPLPHAKAAGQSQSTGVDGVNPGEYGPNGYVYDPKPQSKPARKRTEKELKQERMRKIKREKRNARKLENQKKNVEAQRAARAKREAAAIADKRAKEPGKYADMPEKEIIKIWKAEQPPKPQPPQKKKQKKSPLVANLPRPESSINGDSFIPARKTQLDDGNAGDDFISLGATNGDEAEKPRKTKSEIKAEKKQAREERKEAKKLMHRRLAKDKKKNQEKLKLDVVHGMDIANTRLSNQKRRKAIRLRARLDAYVEKKGGDITIEQAWEEIEQKRLDRKQQRRDAKAVRKEEKQAEKVRKAAAWREKNIKRTNYQKEKEAKLRAAAAGVPYNPALHIGVNAIALDGFKAQKSLPIFQPPSANAVEKAATKLSSIPADKRKQYEERAKEKGMSLEAYAARRAEKKEQKDQQIADRP